MLALCFKAHSGDFSHRHQNANQKHVGPSVNIVPPPRVAQLHLHWFLCVLGLKRVYISVTLDQIFIWTQGQTDFAGQRSKVTVTSLLVGLLMEEQSHDQVEVRTPQCGVQ